MDWAVGPLLERQQSAINVIPNRPRALCSDVRDLLDRELSLLDLLFTCRFSHSYIFLVVTAVRLAAVRVSNLCKTLLFFSARAAKSHVHRSVY